MRQDGNALGVKDGMFLVKKKQQETAVENGKPENWFLIGNFISSQRCFVFFHSLLNLGYIFYRVTVTR